MSFFNKLKKWLYPTMMKAGKAIVPDNKVVENKDLVSPQTSIYDLNIVLNNQQTLSLSTLKGKKVLFVNTASACGLTPQYKELQQLQEAFADSLTIIGFPANDFKEQEKGSDEEIAGFCQMNYGVTFPLAKKSTVIKTPSQNKVFEWLTSANQNGWSDQEPTWNFSKFLVNENGVLTHYFPPIESPLSEEVMKALKK